MKYSIRYGFTLSKQEKDDRTLWVASSNILDKCLGKGYSIDEAIRELSVNEDIWIDTAIKYGTPIPAADRYRSEHPYKVISKKMRSNCLIEYIKAKIKNPYISMVYIPAHISTTKHPHIIWTDGLYDYDFGTDKPLKSYQHICHSGYIRKFELGYAVRYREMLYKRRLRCIRRKKSDKMRAKYQSSTVKS